MEGASNLPAIAGARIAVLFVRDVRVVLDRDLGIAFGVDTKRVNEARTRNSAKFAPEHAF